MMRFVVLISFLTVACTQQAPLQQQAASGGSEAPSDCALKPGRYSVQRADYDRGAGIYRLMVLGAEACFKQPLEVSALKLARADDKATEAATLEYYGPENSTMTMTDSFTVNVAQMVESPSGEMVSQSSAWTPFLAGAAGAAVGAMAGAAIASKMNKPKYYEPPAQTYGQKSVSGFASSGTQYSQVRQSAGLSSSNVPRALRPTGTSPTPMKRYSNSEPTKPKKRSGLFKMRRKKR